MPTSENILIIDFGSQVTKLIARRLREANVYCEIFPCNVSEHKIKEFNPAGIILSGGPASVHDTTAAPYPACVFEMQVPILGICYGQQLICQHLGGQVNPGQQREFGRAMVEKTMSSPLTEGAWQVGEHYQVWMSHGDRVESLPDGFAVIAKSQGAPFAAIMHREQQIYGVQFHPEVVHTPDGQKLLENFAYRICGLSGNWTMASYKEEAITAIQEQVGDKKVICGLSGGVDSSVAAMLIHQAIGDQLTCVFVDTGLLRKDEGTQVVELFRQHYHIPLVHVDAGNTFLNALKGVADPEQKRKIIGGLFIDIFEAEARKIENATFLAQGTLYPDVIESVSFDGSPSVTIKSHHNVGGLPERMNLQLVEPLRELFKDEVRLLGKELGLPAAMVERHPFPGPGLGIRIPGEVTSEKVSILQQADAVYLQEIRKAGLYDEIWQAFAVLLPVKTVGVMGDGRTYEYALGLRAVTSEDGMTADAYHFDVSFLTQVATRIINEVKGVNRVLYDVTSKPPATVEWE